MKIIKFFTSLCLLLAISFPAFSQQDARIKIVNNSSYTVWYLYTSPMGSKHYGKTDLLSTQKPGGASVISSGYYVVIDFNVPDAGNSCWQDIRAETKDGRFWVKTLNVCTESQWILAN